MLWAHDYLVFIVLSALDSYQLDVQGSSSQCVVPVPAASASSGNNEKCKFLALPRDPWVEVQQSVF